MQELRQVINGESYPSFGYAPLQGREPCQGFDGAPLHCSQTERIVIVSPFPGRLQQLIAALSEQCYDVMVFHRWDERLADDLQIGLRIVDFTAAGHPGFRRELAHLAELGDAVPTLYLVNGALPRGAALLQERSRMPWPIHPARALERVRRMIRSEEAAVRRARSLRFKDIELDPKRMTALQSGRRLELTRTEYDLLKALLEAKGSVLTREELIRRVWGFDYFGGSNVVDVHVRSLRKKLGDSVASPRYIDTVRGVGYRLAD